MKKLAKLVILIITLQAYSQSPWTQKKGNYHLHLFLDIILYLETQIIIQKEKFLIELYNFSQNMDYQIKHRYW